MTSPPRSQQCTNRHQSSLLAFACNSKSGSPHLYLPGASVRPALLVAEKEPENGLSTRKLLLETAKFNVITSHSVDEALESLRVFSDGLAGLVVTSHLGPEDECHSVARAFREVRPDAPIFFLSPTGTNHCTWADHHLSTFEPDRLLSLVRTELGDPAKQP